MGPVLLDQILVLADLGLSGVRSPVGSGGITETEVDVRVMLDFVELVADIVGEEDEVQLRVALGYVAGLIKAFNSGYMTVETDGQRGALRVNGNYHSSREWLACHILLP
jgi:hypothetical protein